MDVNELTKDQLALYRRWVTFYKGLDVDSESCHKCAYVNAKAGVPVPVIKKKGSDSFPDMFKSESI